MQTYPAEGPSVAHKWNRDCKERVEADEKEADGHNQDGPTEAEEETLGAARRLCEDNSGNAAEGQGNFKCEAQESPEVRPTWDVLDVGDLKRGIPVEAVD